MLAKKLAKASLKGILLHSKKKGTSEHLFWCFRLSQIEDSIQYLEGPNLIISGTEYRPLFVTT